MDEQKIFEYIRDNLSLSIETEVDYGNKYYVVKLTLTDPSDPAGKDVTLSSDTIYID